MGRKEIGLDMLQLWDVHVSLTREVIIAATVSTSNLQASLDALLDNQRDLGTNIGQIYGKKAGDRYTELLIQHINIAVDIVTEAIQCADTTKSVKEWYDNAREIARFLSKINHCIKRKEIQDLFFAHLDCTLNEALLIVKRDFKGSVDEYKLCLERTRKIALYILDKSFDKKKNYDGPQYS